MNSPSFMDHLRVVLVATRNPLNIGAAARAMSNFGCTHLRLVNPYDPAYREAVSAVGAAPVLANAEQFPTVADAVADCTLVVGTTAAGRRELHHQLCTLEAAAPILLRHLARKNAARAKKNRVALVFGSEKTGLSNEDLSSSGFLDRRTVADADQRIRCLVRRLHLPHRDADMWTGIMRQIIWKLNATANPQPSPRKKTTG